MISSTRGLRRPKPIELSDSLIARFWQDVDKQSDDECWEWQGALREGYGCVKFSGRVINCHRLSFVIHFGEPPAHKPLVVFPGRL